MYSANSDDLYLSVASRITLTTREFLISRLTADDWGLVKEYSARDLAANALNMHLQSLVNLGPRITWEKVWQEMEVFTMRFTDAANEDTRQRLHVLSEVFDRFTNYD